MTDLVLKIHVVHNPEGLPSTYVVDDQGNRVSFVNASTQFHLLCEGGSGLARVAFVLDNVPVECQGSAVEGTFETKTKG